jgi:ubiquinone/menaquinone biosynthesis C-methylase UbiE
LAREKKEKSTLKDYLAHTFSTDDFDLVSVIDELPLWSAPFGLKLLDTIELKRNINALDIGCGLGFPLIEIAQRLGASCKVFGIDPWERAIERSNLKLKIYNIRNVTVIKGVAEKLPFEDDFFDLVVSNNGINNVDDIKASLSECYRVSKPNAQFTITLNLPDTMTEFYDIFEETLTRNGLREEVTKMKDQIYSKRRPLSETKSLLDKAGFNIRSIQQDSFQIGFVDGTAMFDHSLIKYWFIDGWKSVLSLDDLENIFAQLEDRLDVIAKEKGAIYLTIPFVTIDSVRR